MRCFVVFVIAVVTIVAGQIQPSAQQPRQIFCQVANGSVPDWNDNTCRRYFVCQNFNLTTETCPQGQTFSYDNETCVNSTDIDCAAQNLAILTSLQWGTQVGGQLPGSPFPGFNTGVQGGNPFPGFNTGTQGGNPIPPGGNPVPAGTDQTGGLPPPVRTP